MFAKFEIDRLSGGKRYEGNPAARFYFPGVKDKSRKSGGGDATLYLRADLVANLRWIVGDLVDFYWDEESKRIGVKRSVSGVAKVCSQYHTKNKEAQRQVHVNRVIADKIAASWGEERSEGYSVIVTHEIVDDMLVLSFDKIS